MPDLLLTAISYGGYISIVKFIVFLVLFFLWLPVVSWVYTDAKNVGTKEVFWTAIVFGAGATAAIIWLLIPLFIAGMLLYIIAAGAATISYAMHRDTKVSEFDRILTVNFMKNLFASKQKQQDSFENLVFVTANNNQVPLPEPNTPDFYGYQSAYKILTDAVWRRASDITFSPTPQDYNVIYSIDGAALKQPPIAKDQMDYFARFLKNLADLDPNEKRKPQKGRFNISLNKEFIGWQVTSAGSTAGEHVRLKHIIKGGIARLADIGLTTGQLEQSKKLREAKQGLFIIAGPRKTGVTTTFYALLKEHDPYVHNINTFEKQPSAELSDITQNIFTLGDTGTTTYAKKLLTIVRMEPDILGIADCDDPEAAQIAATAAKEGRLIYLTLQADNVIQALAKWMELVGDKNLAADSLLGISNQRLLRKLCNECKQAYEPNKELLRKFNMPAEKTKVLYRAGKVQYGKRGRERICENCQGTGFVGRTAIFEIIMLNEQLRNTIKQSKSLAEINTQFRRAKMLYLQEQALKKTIKGTTAINEMVRILTASKKKKAKKPK